MFSSALSAPLYWIATNAGLDGSVVVNKVSELPDGQGFNAATLDLRRPGRRRHRRPGQGHPLGGAERRVGGADDPHHRDRGRGQAGRGRRRRPRSWPRPRSLALEPFTTKHPRLHEPGVFSSIVLRRPILPITAGLTTRRQLANRTTGMSSSDVQGSTKRRAGAYLCATKARRIERRDTAAIHPDAGNRHHTATARFLPDASAERINVVDFGKADVLILLMPQGLARGSVSLVPRGERVAVFVSHEGHVVGNEEHHGVDASSQFDPALRAIGLGTTSDRRPACLPSLEKHGACAFMQLRILQFRSLVNRRTRYVQTSELALPDVLGKVDDCHLQTPFLWAPRMTLDDRPHTAGPRNRHPGKDQIFGRPLQRA